MGRRCTCNELISAEQREMVVELYTTSWRIYADISDLTQVPIEKIKAMTKALRRPDRTEKLTAKERSDLLMGWR